ncbi:Hsp70 family protein [Pseudonocardia endophytica]|uniref:Hsp70 protein n=1 Tax=Pseudonocardia endophytica TaxID=401976 RepID=A0A4V2PJA2_PSEEN|nr:Hsp70 family protein [Pseudonocardia endophytica]TCK27756.1 Hsp70 protein [Pseudonocardia endophytica]
MSYLLGIDLGTTYTAAAVLRTRGGEAVGEPEMVGLGAHGSEMPSVVLDGEDGSLLVGDAAERRAMVEPDRVAREFKRRIGDPTPVSLGTGALPAEELAATVVRHVVDTAAAREGGMPERIALTHPASWGGHKLELLRSALDPALEGLGAPQVEFLAEPQAAAVCYAAAERVEPGSTIAVYDLGGGTFDSAVVRKDAPGSGTGGFTLLGRPEGLEFLGGVDFDEVVFEHVRAGAGDAFAGLDESDPAVWAAVARLRRECREAKEGLSSDTEVSVPVWLGGAQTVVRLHRSEFEELIGPRIEDSVEALRRAVDSAGLDPSELSSVLLVGGSSRIPLVAQTVSERLDRPVAVDADPKNAIAKGAALAMLPRHAASWPAVEVPVQRAVPEESDVERTGPIETVALSFQDAPTERFAAVALLEPATRIAAAPVRPGFTGTSSYVTQDTGPQRGTDNRARWLVGAGGLAGALAIVAAVLLWPTAAVTLDGASARSIVPDTGAAPTTSAPPAPAAPAAPSTEPHQGATTNRATDPTKRPAAPAPAVIPPVAPAPAAPKAPTAPAAPAPVVKDPVKVPPKDDTSKEPTTPVDPCKPTDGSTPPASCTATPPAPAAGS